MSNILEQLSTSQRFIPSTADEFLALQLAKRLRDEAAIPRYIHYVAQHPIQQLVRLYHRAKQTDDPALTFHSFLKPPKQ